MKEKLESHYTTKDAHFTEVSAPNIKLLQCNVVNSAVKLNIILANLYDACYKIIKIGAA